ncbi:MAG: hypothetical protein Q9213_002774 [Squamulea squamosa]
MVSAQDDTSNFFKRSHYDEDYWNEYLAAHPEYDQPFYQSIYDYHRSHNGLFGTAHDIATGPGQVAAELSTRFNHVVASDVNPTHLDPNGTLAIWFYGRPIFAEPEYFDRCQPLFGSILDLSFAPILKAAGPMAKAGCKRATDRMVSFFDDIELPSDVWRDIKRQKWNSKHPMPFNGPAACDFDIETSSAVKEGEEVVETEVADFWERQWDLVGVKRFVSVNLPTFDEGRKDEKADELYKELGKAMGGEGTLRKITWPVVRILASKK